MLKHTLRNPAGDLDNAVTMRPKISIQGYLTELKLQDALEAVCGKAWRGAQIRIPGSRRSWDMAVAISPTQIAVVEYDGEVHYCNTLKIKADQEKDQIAAREGFALVRIPYWVQLTAPTLAHYFRIDAVVEQNFPHGFITTRWFPASFCELGIERFEREFQLLPTEVQSDVLVSLKKRSEEHGIDYVLPKSLRHWVEA